MDLRAFVKQNAPYMTLKDLSDESGVSMGNVKNALVALGITPVSQKQKIADFILLHYKKKSKKWMAKVCDMSMSNISVYYKELNIEEPDFKPEGELISAAKILSEYKVSGHITMNQKLVLPLNINKT